MVDIFSSPPFYTDHVKLPTADDPVPPEIQQNPNSGCWNTQTPEHANRTCFYFRKLLSYTLILLRSLITYFFSCCPHFQYLGSISSYIFYLYLHHLSPQPVLFASFLCLVISATNSSQHSHRSFFNTGPISKMLWEPLIGVISILQPLHHFVIFTKTAKATSPKIASLPVHLVFSFSMLSLDGKARCRVWCLWSAAPPMLWCALPSCRIGSCKCAVCDLSFQKYKIFDQIFNL